MGRKHKIRDQKSIYFVTFTVVKWLDVFTRNDYRMILLDSIKYCQEKKGLLVYAWAFMTNHIHLIVSADGDSGLSDIVRDFKRHTSKHIRQAIEQHPAESRKSWMIWLLEKEGKFNRNNIDWQLWQQHNHPVELSDGNMAKQKLDYLHNNPVKAGFVSE